MARGRGRGRGGLNRLNRDGNSQSQVGFCVLILIRGTGDSCKCAEQRWQQQQHVALRIVGEFEIGASRSCDSFHHYFAAAALAFTRAGEQLSFDRILSEEDSCVFFALCGLS